ncbi:MAG: hypothetical protein HQK64_11650 [Desulfamplus sp.]|nr:hypothetical protein [Desulfamplus sp.]
MPDNNMPSNSNIESDISSQSVAESGDLFNTILTTLIDTTSGGSDYEYGLDQIRQAVKEHVAAQGGNPNEIEKAVENFMDNLSSNLNQGVSPEDSLRQAVVEADLTVVQEKINAQSESDAEEDNLAQAFASGQNVDELIEQHLPDGVSKDSDAAGAMLSNLQDSLSSGKSTSKALEDAQQTATDNFVAESSTQGEISEAGKLVMALASGENIDEVLSKFTDGMSPDQIGTFIDSFIKSLESGGSTEEAIASAQEKVEALSEAAESVQGEMTPEAAIAEALASGENVAETVSNLQGEGNTEAFEQAMVQALAEGHASI